MNSGINRQFRLKTRPIGDIKESNFEYREEPIPSPKDGEVLVRTIYLSLDPTNRIWMSDIPQYMAAVEIGQVMRGVVIGVVEESKNPNFQPGDLVSGTLGWQDYAIAFGNSGSSVTLLSETYSNLLRFNVQFLFHSRESAPSCPQAFSLSGDKTSTSS